jgi:hypothetical protein
MHKTWLLLLPELRRCCPDEQEHVLANARHTRLDIFELLGMAFAVVAAAALTQYSLATYAALAGPAAALLDVAVALPLMVMCAGPFHLRRLRRGLREQLALRGLHE